MSQTPSVDISIEERELGHITKEQVDEEEIDLQEDSSVEEFPMNKGYSWVILCCTFILTMAAWGNNSGYAIYFAYYSSNEIYKGSTTLDFAAIGGIIFGVGITFAPIINYITGKLGLKWILMLGNLFQFLSLFLTSFDSHKHLWQVFLTQGVLQSLGLALLGLPSFTILPHWFHNTGDKSHYRIKDRMLTLSQGISTAGSGAGGILFNLGMQKILESHGAAWALRTQSFISLFLVTTSIILLRERHSGVKIAFTLINMEILKFPGFWGLVSYVTFSMLGYVVTLYSLADWTIALGYTAYQGSIVAAVVATGMIIGRPIIGMLSDRFGAFTVAGIVYLTCSILVLTMWIVGKNYATALVFGLFMGALSGTFFPTFATVCLNVLGFRLAKFNVTFYMSWVSLGIAACFSPIIGIALRERAPGPLGYKFCAIFVGVSFLMNTLTIILLRGYVISMRNITSPDMTDTQYFGSIPKLSDILRNCFRFRGVGWL
ncbi:monocarboxylate transporter [Scheffersomyces amazonensis]|uniref:monocarboxylate transporter n=1 Tax=Scheffersomyces amazonensis TaxID=1078765 RepID=UPI00315CF9E0